MVLMVDGASVKMLACHGPERIWYDHRQTCSSLFISEFYVAEKDDDLLVKLAKYGSQGHGVEVMI